MGMQVHWNIKDVPDYAVLVTSSEEDDTHVITIKIEGCADVVVRDWTEGCWFDCGSCSEWSMNMIQWLIRNRIPFIAS